MALSFISKGEAAAATGTLGSFVPGDLCVVFAYRSNSTAPPSLPGTFQDVASSSGANTNSRRIGYRVLQAGDVDIGAWTNATAVEWIVLRGQHSTPIGAVASGGSNTTTLTTPTLTLQNASGTSWVLGFAGSKSTNANSVTLSSTTARSGSVGALNLATGEEATAWASRAYSAAVNAGGNRVDAVEVLAAPTTTGTARLSLGSGTEPSTRTSHSLKVRARKTNAAHTATVRVQLYEGATARSAEYESSALTTSIAEYTLALTNVEAEAITSYANLEVRVRGYSSTGHLATIEVAEVSLQTPASSGTQISGSEVLTASDSALLSATISGTETLALSDAALLTTTDLLNTSDSGALTDQASLGNSTGITGSDSVALTDEAALNDSTGITGSDSLSVSEAQLISDTTAISDSVALSEFASISSSGPTSTGTCRLGLTGLAPNSRTEHKLVIRARKTDAGHTLTVRGQLFEGATSRSTEKESAALTTSFADYVLSFSDAEAQSIIDYSNVEVAFKGYSSAGDPATIEVAEVWMEIPAAATTLSRSDSLVFIESVTQSIELQAGVADAGALADSSSVASATPPGAPIITNVTPGDGAGTVEFTEPANNGATIIEYEVLEEAVSLNQISGSDSLILSDSSGVLTELSVALADNLTQADAAAVVTAMSAVDNLTQADAAAVVTAMSAVDNLTQADAAAVVTSMGAVDSAVENAVTALAAETGAFESSVLLESVAILQTAFVAGLEQHSLSSIAEASVSLARNDTVALNELSISSAQEAKDAFESLVLIGELAVAGPLGVAPTVRLPTTVAVQLWAATVVLASYTGSATIADKRALATVTGTIGEVLIVDSQRNVEIATKTASVSFG